jgi:hypothetical protein
MIFKHVRDLFPEKYNNKVTLEQFKAERKEANIDIEKIISEERYEEKRNDI